MRMTLPSRAARRCLVPAIALLVCLMPTAPAVAQAWEHEEAMHEAHVQELHELLEMLEHGIVATDRLGHKELRDALHELAQELRMEIERAHRGVDVERERVHRDREREHEALMREREAQAREREARDRARAAQDREREARDREHEARDREHEARDREREARDRQHAARERQHETRQRRREAGERQRDARDRARRAPRPQAGNTRAMAERRLEMMRMAMPALREAGHMDSAERLERAMVAAELAVEGRDDPEAQRVRKEAPAPGAQIMLIMEASALWDEFGHDTKAATLRAYADEMLAGRATGRRGAARNERRPAAGPDRMLLERIESLERRLDELEQMLRQLDEPARRR